jgi:N-acetylneuraminic acid mutarotase
MVHVSVEDAFENFDNPGLTPEANGLLTNVGAPESERFRQRFGDVFIDGLRRGGEYFATWEIVSTDQSVREKIATHVEAGFDDILASAHLDVDIQNASASTSSHVEVHVHVFQAGSIDHTDQTMAEIMQKAHDFPPTVAGNLAVPFAVSLANYNALQLPNDRFNFLDIQNQRDVLAEHAQKRFDFLTRRNSISYARQHPDQFVVDDAKLAKELSDITEAINKMEAEASACLRDASHCTFTPFDISDFPLPPPLPPSTPNHDTWATKAPMPTARIDLAVAAAGNGKVYATGGFNNVGNTVATLEEYDPATNSWATKAPMPTARVALSLAAADNGKIYAVGGISGQRIPDPAFATMEEYDPATNSWATKAPMPTARSRLGLAAALNGKVYATGGFSNVGHTVATLEEYDPATNSWATKAPMPTRRSSLGLAAAGNGRIYAVGGGDVVATVEEYDSTTNSWLTKAPMPTAREQLGLAAASNGKIYAVGGIGPNATTLATVEEYTP